MVSQFISTHKVGLLGDVNFNFPEGTHAIGRLDAPSEGLLLLTTDKRVTRLLFLAATPHQRKYLVMVQNIITPETLQQLKEGVKIRIANGEYYTAKPAAIEIIKNPQLLYKFSADARGKYPHTWLLITLTEGKFRQVRKMVLAVRHRCLRLIRLSISNIKIDGIAPGAVKELSAAEFYTGLDIAAAE
jgi:23S rRNA pseudouridine2457 synthase